MRYLCVIKKIESYGGDLAITFRHSRGEEKHYFQGAGFLADFIDDKLKNELFWASNNTENPYEWDISVVKNDDDIDLPFLSNLFFDPGGE